MKSILDKIVRVRKQRLDQEKVRMPMERLEHLAGVRTRCRDFVGAFAGPGLHIIAEVKKASPSRGVIREDLNPSVLATSYQAGGARAVSVVTEQDHFQGDISVLEEVRSCVSLPILRKDFIVDLYQIVEARAAGADSYLLIAALLDAETMRSLIRRGRELQMEPLVEVHNVPELHQALECDAAVIGINNRDLTTFQVDLKTTLDLVRHIPSDRIVVSESGIRSRDEMLVLAEQGCERFSYRRNTREVGRPCNHHPGVDQWSLKQQCPA